MLITGDHLSKGVRPDFKQYVESRELRNKKCGFDNNLIESELCKFLEGANRESSKAKFLRQ